MKENKNPAKKFNERELAEIAILIGLVPSLAATYENLQKKFLMGIDSCQVLTAKDYFHMIRQLPDFTILFQDFITGKNIPENVCRGFSVFDLPIQWINKNE